MISLESSNLEIWIYLNNGGFSLQMGAHNNFARMAMDPAIKEKANKNKQTSSGSKGYNLKRAKMCKKVQWYGTLLQLTTEEFFCTWRNGNI